MPSDTLDVFTNAGMRPVRPRISTSPVNMVPKRGPGIPQQVGDDHADRLGGQRRLTALTPAQPMAAQPQAMAKLQPRAPGSPGINTAGLQGGRSSGGIDTSGLPGGGGTVTRNGVTTPARVSTNTATRGGVTTGLTPARAPGGTATRGASPLAAPATGALQPGGTAEPAPMAAPNPARALGFNQNGGRTPQGDDMRPGAGAGGLFSGEFPGNENVYAKRAGRLFQGRGMV